jgi:hypothetical protein
MVPQLQTHPPTGDHADKKMRGMPEAMPRKF